MRLIILPITAILAGAAIAGCGGSSKPPASNSQHGPSFKTVVADADRQAACMRDQGVSNYPDPQVTQKTGPGGAVQQMVRIQAPGSGGPKFQAAMKACAKYAPPIPHGNINQGQSAAQIRMHRDALLAFAKCMRTHGFPSFPDPNTQGDLSLTAVTNAGIQIHQPAVLHAGLTCAGATHGVLTKADVERAVNRGSGNSGSGNSGSGNTGAG